MTPYALNFFDEDERNAPCRRDIVISEPDNIVNKAAQSMRPGEKVVVVSPLTSLSPGLSNGFRLDDHKLG